MRQCKQATHDIGGASGEQRRQQRVQLAQLVAAGDGVEQVVSHQREAPAAAVVRDNMGQLQIPGILTPRAKHRTTATFRR